MTLNDATKRVMNLAEAKNFPRTKDKMGILLTRINIELAEAQDAWLKGDEANMTVELIDTLIQTLQALGTVKTIDIDSLFNVIMSVNETRDFSRHKEILEK